MLTNVLTFQDHEAKLWNLIGWCITWRYEHDMINRKSFEQMLCMHACMHVN